MALFKFSTYFTVPRHDTTITTVQNRADVPSRRGNDSVDHPRPDASVIRCVESAVAEGVAISAVVVRGDIPPKRVSPLALAVRGVRGHGDLSSVDGPRGRSGHPRKPTTRRPVSPIIIDWGGLLPEWKSCRIGGAKPPTVKVSPSHHCDATGSNHVSVVAGLACLKWFANASVQRFTPLKSRSAVF